MKCSRGHTRWFCLINTKVRKKDPGCCRVDVGGEERGGGGEGGGGGGLGEGGSGLGQGGTLHQAKQKQRELSCLRGASGEQPPSGAFTLEVNSNFDFILPRSLSHPPSLPQRLSLPQSLPAPPCHPPLSPSPPVCHILHPALHLSDMRT